MIRKATTHDAKAIAEVHVKSWQAAYRGLLPDEFLQNLSVEQREQQWKAGAENLEQIILVYEIERIVAFCSFAPSKDPGIDKSKVAELGTFYALEKFWGQGIGKQLWLEATRHMRERAFNEVTLWVLQGNDRAIKFYEQMGLVFDGQTKTETRPGGITLHELHYRKRL